MADSLPPDMLDIPASVVEQIPLGVQIIDLDSLKASDRPTGQAIYPDSIIPVSSFTHGQHPDTKSAQTVQTDGNHALKVALSSGGSPAIRPLDPNKGFQRANGSLGFGFTQIANVACTWRYLYGGTFSVSWDGESTTELSNGRTSLYIGTSAALRVPVASVWMPTTDLGAHTPLWTESMQLCASGPIDMGGIFGDTASPLMLWIENFASPVIFDVVVITDAV